MGCKFASPKCNHAFLRILCSPDSFHKNSSWSLHNKQGWKQFLDASFMRVGMWEHVVRKVRASAGILTCLTTSRPWPFAHQDPLTLNCPRFLEMDNELGQKRTWSFSTTLSRGILMWGLALLPIVYSTSNPATPKDASFQNSNMRGYYSKYPSRLVSNGVMTCWQWLPRIGTKK